MLTLAQVKVISDDIMFDEGTIRAAADVLKAEGLDAQMDALQTMAQVVIVITLDHLSKVIEGIPSTRTLVSAMLEEAVENFVKGLDNPTAL